MGAFENQMVKFKTAGIFDFRQWGFKGRAIAVQHASFMIVTLQVIGELEKALDEYARCYEPRDTCSAVKSVDQAVAYYVGSLAADGKGDGNLMSTLADFSCIEMKTCDYTGDSLTGPAKVNLEIIPLFWLMKDAIVNRHFAQAKSYKEAIAAKMFIPLIQSLLRFTYENQYVIQSEETEAQAFMFATSILPLVHDCNPNDATTILTNLRIGQEGTLEFASVKAAIENNYECMQITCEDIGGIYDSTNAKYYDGAGPCTLA